MEKESRINETTSSIETQLREEVRTAVEKEKSAWAKKQEALRWEIESLRQDVTRVEQQHAIREDMLRKEIADLQQVAYSNHLILTQIVNDYKNVWILKVFFHKH